MRRQGRKLSVTTRPQTVKPYHFPGLPGSQAAPDPQTAWQQGYDQGLEQGRQAGHEEGLAMGLEEGREQGRAEGLTRGQQQGERQGRAAFEQALAPVQSLLGTLSHWQAAQRPLQQTLIAALVEQVARQVIQQELRQHPEAVADLVSRLLAGLPAESQNLSLWLSPTDQAALAAIGVTELQGWPLKACASLQPGDCRLEQPDTTLESLCAERLTQALAAVSTLLEEAQPC